jgi:DNA phosphorothioation-dependent restriction protein DptG
MSDTLEQLEELRVAKFKQISDLIATTMLGFRNLDTLSDDQRSTLKERVEDAIEEWEETVTMEPPRESKTPLEVLLRDYHEICEQMLGAREEILDARETSQEVDAIEKKG